MSEEKTKVVIVGEVSPSLSHALAMQNIQIIGAGLSAGLSVDMIAPFCTPQPQKAKPTPVLTEQDQRSIAAAEAKRARKAAKKSVADPTEGKEP